VLRWRGMERTARQGGWPVHREHDACASICSTFTCWREAAWCATLRAGWSARSVTPLFETIEDLENSGACWRFPGAPHDHANTRLPATPVQEVMIVTATVTRCASCSHWYLRKAQIRLAAVAREAGVELRFFHAAAEPLAAGRADARIPGIACSGTCTGKYASPNRAK